MSDLVQTKPTGKPRRKEQTAYGFVPAIELRHEFSRAGELVEVNARGEIVNRWSVVRNDHVCVMMKDRTIVLPKGFPIMAARGSSTCPFPIRLRVRCGCECARRR